MAPGLGGGVTYCPAHDREDCDACADETRLEDEYDELYCALQALVAQLIMSELPIERVRGIVKQVRVNLACVGTIRATELAPGLSRVVFDIVHELLNDTKARATSREETPSDG